MKKLLLILLLVIPMVSCAPKIPPEAPTLNQHVSQGIEALKQNALDIVDAWEVVASTVVNDQWTQLYQKAEKAYWGKRTPAGDNGAASSEQNMEIAALAGLMKDELNRHVREKAAEMRQQVMTNADATLRMNNNVTDLLTSARQVIESNEELLSTVTDIIPVPTGLLEVKP